MAILFQSQYHYQGYVAFSMCASPQFESEVFIILFLVTASSEKENFLIEWAFKICVSFGENIAPIPISLFHSFECHQTYQPNESLRHLLLSIESILYERILNQILYHTTESLSRLIGFCIERRRHCVLPYKLMPILYT